jgi:hypothetical protein
MPPNKVRQFAVPNSVAGNGIFGCRDRRPKIHPRDRYQGTLKIGGKTPAETACFRSTTVSAVREDWMVDRQPASLPVTVQRGKHLLCRHTDLAARMNGPSTAIHTPAPATHPDRTGLRSLSPKNGNISNIRGRLSAISLPQRPIWEPGDR